MTALLCLNTSCTMMEVISDSSLSRKMYILSEFPFLFKEILNRVRSVLLRLTSPFPKSTLTFTPPPPPLFRV